MGWASKAPYMLGSQTLTSIIYLRSAVRSSSFEARRMIVSTMAQHKKASAAAKPPLTHFLCLPLVTPTSRSQLNGSMDDFRAAVTSTSADENQVEESEEEQNAAKQTIVSAIHPRAIRPVGALHCTLGVMSLNKTQLEDAIKCLQDVDVESLLRKAAEASTSSSIYKVESSRELASTADDALNRPESESTASSNRSRSEQPLKVNLQGLESMHPPQKTSILYSGPQDITNRLRPFCLALQKAFRDRDLLVKDERPLKLHATIVNTIYAKGRKKSGNNNTQGHGPKANAPLKIDARDILQRFRDFVWAEDVTIDRVAICEMGTKKIFDDEGNLRGEEYREVASLSLPG